MPTVDWREANPLLMIPYIGCYLCIVWHNDPPADLRWRMSFHMTASGRYPYSRALKYLHRMRELNRVVVPPDWQILAIASDVQLTQIPLIVTPSVWAWQAAQSLIVFIFLVIQVEMTIVWNHIDGLKTLSSLGQLIPFILGVGGLLNVLWVKWHLARKGIREDVDANFRPRSDYEEAMMRYLEWSKAMEKPTVAGPPNLDEPMTFTQGGDPPMSQQLSKV